MYSRPGLLVILCLWGSPLRAQDSVLTRLQIRADSLLRAWRQAEGIAALADSLERERATAGRDTIAVGALRIIANPSPLPLRDAAAAAWPAIDSLYGNAAADLAQRPYVIHAVDPESRERRPVLRVGVEVPWDLDLRMTTTLLLTSVPVAAPDRALVEWLGGPIRPSLRPHEDRVAVYVQLVTAPSQTVRNCFLGSIARCVDALQLVDTSALLERWYPTPEERQELVVRSFADFFNHGASTQAFRSCVTGDDAACTGLLRSLPPATLPKPIAHAARATLVREALRLGGRDAYRRLLQDPDAPIGERLAAAAAAPLDSLVARWRAAVLATRPPAVALSWWAVAAAVGWLAVFATCGLQSSRWRL